MTTIAQLYRTLETTGKAQARAQVNRQETDALAQAHQDAITVYTAALEADNDYVDYLSTDDPEWSPTLQASYLSYCIISKEIDRALLAKWS